MTYEEFFVCLENALNAETVGVTFNADGMMISESENESYLSQHDIVLQKGIVTGAYYMNLNPNIVMGKDEPENIDEVGLWLNVIDDDSNQ